MTAPADISEPLHELGELLADAGGIEKLREDSDAAVEQIKPLLAGKGSLLQGSILADLVAIWICGHLVPGKPAATQELQADMLGVHQQTVASLIEHYRARPTC
jgi:hypothetical protein